MHDSAAMAQTQTESARSAEGFWPHAVVTPAKAEKIGDYDAARLKFGWRELGAIFSTMIPVLFALWALHAQIDTLGAKFDGYRDLQNERFSNLQREFDELKREERMNKVLLDENSKKISAVEGALLQIQRK